MKNNLFPTLNANDCNDICKYITFSVHMINKTNSIFSKICQNNAFITYYGSKIKYT